MTGTLSYVFTADRTALRTMVGDRRGGVIQVSDSAAGVALYGPYVPVPAGTYKAIVHFTTDSSCRGTAVLDVCCDSGSRILHRKDVSAEDINNNGMTAVITFSCDKTAADLEVRLLSDGGFVAEIESLSIEGELRDPFQRVQLTDLPAVPVRNKLFRGRNLYDGYQRGTGLQFGDLTAKIAADPDFIEARQLAADRTILGDASLANIFLIIKFYLPRLAFGNMIEFGSYKGGGAIFMAVLARKFLPGCRVFSFDTFAGMPPTDQFVDHHQAGAFAGVDFAELQQYARNSGIDNLEFVQGHFGDTAAPTLDRVGSVSLCHIDCDIRSAIQCAYDATKPHMVAGGYWILDDPMVSDCLGAAEAMEDLLIRRDGLNSEQVFPHYIFRQP